MSRPKFLGSGTLFDQIKKEGQSNFKLDGVVYTNPSTRREKSDRVEAVERVLYIIKHREGVDISENGA